MGCDMGTSRGYDALIGTGGLGSGIYFALEGDETVGREESRGGHLLDRRDYGKLHIVCHYVRVLLGDEFLVVPVGRLGADDAGDIVRRELCHLGLDLSHVGTDEARPTLFSVCFAYPRGEGGNFTALNSASAVVTSEDVRATQPMFERFRDRGIALAAPEVPILARATLLSLATEYGFLRVGSFVTAELRDGLADPLLELLDVLAINIDEAAALAACAPGESAEAVTAAAVEFVRDKHSQLSIVVTAGRYGSWVWDGLRLSRDRGIETQVVNAAGAGDAHLGAVIVALASGLSIRDANHFATIVSTLKVGSQDTINRAIDVAAVEEAAGRFKRAIPVPLLERLTAPPRRSATKRTNAVFG